MVPRKCSMIFAIPTSIALAAGVAGAAAAAEPPGVTQTEPAPWTDRVVQTDTLGMNLATWNFTKGSATTIADAQVLSEFVGAHYYVGKDVRLGMNLQFSEQLAPQLQAGSPFRIFALLPQVGWNVGGPFFVAGTLTLAPFTGGGWSWVLGVQAVGGAAWEIAKRVKLTAAIEVPYNFYPAQTLGLTPLLGASFRL